MTSTTFFIIFIPILSILLLSINLILAPHNPYQEKDSVFECGFHSFLGQNRTQFTVSFFIFALLFLLFDLEILLVYPYSVSGYNNDIYGLAIMMLFFILLTLGFVFELGKNALTIDSKQTISYNNEETPESDVFMAYMSYSSMTPFMFLARHFLSLLPTKLTNHMAGLLSIKLFPLWNSNLLLYTYITKLSNIIQKRTYFCKYALVYLQLSFNCNNMVRPHRFSNKLLQSEPSIFDIVGQISTLMPQLADFINQFNTTVNESGVNVVTDTAGNMSVSVPGSMTDEVANAISKKIGIIDRLINTREQEISDLLQKGTSIEDKLKMDNPKYVSQLTDKLKEFKQLNSSYKH